MFLFSCVESQEDLEDAVETSGGKARSVKSEYERYSYLYSLSREKLSKKVTNPALIEKLKKMIGAGSDIKSLYSLFNIYSIFLNTKQLLSATIKPFAAKLCGFRKVRTKSKKKYYIFAVIAFIAVLYPVYLAFVDANGLGSVIKSLITTP